MSHKIQLLWHLLHCHTKYGFSGIPIVVTRSSKPLLIHTQYSNFLSHVFSHFHTILKNFSIQRYKDNHKKIPHSTINVFFHHYGFVLIQGLIALHFQNLSKHRVISHSLHRKTLDKAPKPIALHSWFLQNLASGSYFKLWLYVMSMAPTSNK